MNGIKVIKKALDGMVTTRANLNKGVTMCEQAMEVKIETIRAAEEQAELLNFHIRQANETISNITSLLPKGLK